MRLDALEGLEILEELEKLETLEGLEEKLNVPERALLVIVMASNGNYENQNLFLLNFIE